MKVWELMRELEKAPAGSEVVLFDDAKDNQFTISMVLFGDGTMEAFTERYNVTVHIGNKVPL